MWKKCNMCKKPIDFKAKYWVCNVSTCNRLRTGLSFCSVSCWDAHLPFVNHREAWAEERKAPTPDEWKQIQLDAEAPIQRTRKAAQKDPEAVEPAPNPRPQGPQVILRKK